MCWSRRLSPAFFARGDTVTPLLATLKGLAVAIVLAVILGQISGVGGIAAGIALGAWSNALALIRRGAVTFGFSIDAAARRRLPRIAASALAMGGALWLTTRFVPALATAPHGLAQAVLLGLMIAGGIAIYGLLLALLGVVNWRQAIRAAGQKPVRDLRD